MELISVVIPAFNEESAIADCLQSLVRQKTKRSFEVIVVNNGSTDKTAEVAKSFKTKLRIKVIDEKRKGRGRARATGFDAAKGSIIFSTDADSILPPTWIEEMAAVLSKTGYVCVTTPCVINDSHRRNREIVRRTHQVLHEIYYIANGHHMVYGFSFAVRKDAYIKAGKINPKLKSLDDIDFGKRVAEVGKVRYLRSLYVTVSNRRYRDNVIRGIFSYTKPFIHTVYLGKSLDMSDIR